MKDRELFEVDMIEAPSLDQKPPSENEDQQTLDLKQLPLSNDQSPDLRQKKRKADLFSSSTFSSSIISSPAQRLKFQQEPSQPKTVNGLIVNENLEQVEKRLSSTETAQQWKKVGINHHHGVVVSVSSLRSFHNYCSDPSKQQDIENFNSTQPLVSMIEEKINDTEVVHIWLGPRQENNDVNSLNENERKRIKEFNQSDLNLSNLESLGCGEFFDLLQLIKSFGKRENVSSSTSFLSVIQVLPINDVQEISGDSPFSPVSAIALNPLLLSLKQLPSMSISVPSSSSVNTIREFVQELNNTTLELRKLEVLPTIDWTNVRKLKLKWLNAFFALWKLAGLENLSIDGKSYLQFKEEEKQWLVPYALFCSLKNQNGWNKSWEEWDETERNLGLNGNVDDNPVFQEITQHQHAYQVEFYCFLQFLCSLQLQFVRKVADQCNVLLKGDIPYLVGKDSADVWMNQSWFQLDYTAGAPPDMYNSEGQDWGLPIYNWENMKKDELKWWKARLHVSSKYYHLYRIDHIAGFFRIWTIPKGKKPTEGSYKPESESEWIPNGEELLKMVIKTADMLPIGEDLGTIPPGMRTSLQKLGICGTKILRWEREWENKDQGQPFINPNTFNRDSMTTLSTHDSETLDQWWFNMTKEEQTAFAKYLEQDPKALIVWGKERENSNIKRMPKEIRTFLLTQSHLSTSLFHINPFSEYLHYAEPEEKYLHEDLILERINVPGTVTKQNWAYRMKTPVKDVLSNPSWNQFINDLSKSCSLAK